MKRVIIFLSAILTLNCNNKHSTNIPSIDRTQVNFNITGFVKDSEEVKRILGNESYTFLKQRLQPADLSERFLYVSITNNSPRPIYVETADNSRILVEVTISKYMDSKWKNDNSINDWQTNYVKIVPNSETNCYLKLGEKPDSLLVDFTYFYDSLSTNLNHIVQKYYRTQVGYQILYPAAQSSLISHVPSHSLCPQALCWSAGLGET